MIRPCRSKALSAFKQDEYIEDLKSKPKKKKRLVRVRDLGCTEPIITERKVYKPLEETARVSINMNNIREEKLSRKEKHFRKLLNDGLFNEFDKYDWMEYFKYKAKKHSINYRWNNYMKESQVMAGLIKRFEASEIKLMIDFLWDCNHEMFVGKVLGIYMLSEAWGSQNSRFQNALLWRDGKFKTERQLKREMKNDNSRNRNWVADDGQKEGVKIRI